MSLVAFRFIIEPLGVVGAMGCILVTGLAGAAYIAASHGYRSAHASLLSNDQLTHGAAAHVLALVAVLVIGLVCGGYVVFRAM